jgi:uncharacterized protein YcgI (DUF1989 family)
MLGSIMADGLQVADEGDIPIGRATILEIGAGCRLRIIDHLGQQVVDTWIFVAGTKLSETGLATMREYHSSYGE